MQLHKKLTFISAKEGQKYEKPAEKEAGPKFKFLLLFLLIFPISVAAERENAKTLIEYQRMDTLPLMTKGYVAMKPVVTLKEEVFEELFDVFLINNRYNFEVHISTYLTRTYIHMD